MPGVRGLFAFRRPAAYARAASTLDLRQQVQEVGGHYSVAFCVGVEIVRKQVGVAGVEHVQAVNVVAHVETKGVDSAYKFMLIQAARRLLSGLDMTDAQTAIWHKYEKA